MPAVKRASAVLLAAPGSLAVICPVAGTAPVEKLPDVVQSIPRELQVQTVDTHAGPDYWLGCPAHGVSASCRLHERGAATCAVRGRAGSVSYSRKLPLASTRGGVPFVRYAALAGSGPSLAYLGRLRAKL